MTGAEVRIVCHRTGKQVYATLARVLYHQARVQLRTGRPYRVYQCEFCGYWHLTSRKRRS